MKKLLYLGFCLVLTLGIGCAVTNYELMVDQYNGEIENTNGKARILKGSQTASIYSDGADNLFSYVDQKANGDRTLTTVNFFTTDGSFFLDQTFCTPDWNGCSIWTADDPEVGDSSIFDGNWNQNCSGSRSLSYLVSTTRYYGECGRALSQLDRINLFANLNWTSPSEASMVLARNNFSLKLNGQDGTSLNLPIHGSVPVSIDFRNNTLMVDARNPLLGTVAARASQFLREHGPAFGLTATIEGVKLNQDNLHAGPNSLASRF